MKRLIALLALALALVSTGSARADETAPTKLKLRDDFWYHVAASPLYAWLAVFTHETSHALAAEAVGVPVSRFEPYPGWDPEPQPNGHRRWHYGIVYYGRGYYTNDQLTTANVAPYVVQPVVFAGSDLALSYMDKDGLPAAITYFAGMAWQWVFFAKDVNDYHEDSDLSKVERNGLMSRPTRVIVGNALVLVGAWRLYARGKDVLVRRVPAAPPPATIVSVTPLAIPNGFGLGAFGIF